ncbi:MAG TPA: hypothetical protein VJJ46_05320 [Anaerolineales bacterium]|nr:hypothetical protein [Anaerolineales bacterium]
MYARLDPDHRVVPCTLEEWGTLFSWEPGCFEKERRVAWTGLVGAEVSTVFLGLNHAYADGADEWFETLVFGGPHDGELERYATWDEAIAGHEATVERLREEPPTTSS